MTQKNGGPWPRTGSSIKKSSSQNASGGRFENNPDFLGIHQLPGFNKPSLRLRDAAKRSGWQSCGKMHAPNLTLSSLDENRRRRQAEWTLWWSLCFRHLKLQPMQAQILLNQANLWHIALAARCLNLTSAYKEGLETYILKFRWDNQDGIWLDQRQRG